ncbi:MAG: hypothetical protein OSB02_09415 [Rhodospirillaceae bacterium]|nr:hypothetical protein [Rhodospirillaceae bacterium]
MDFETSEGRFLEAMLLRAEYPASDGFGRDDRLRLMITDPDMNEILAMTGEAALSERIRVSSHGSEVECQMTDPSDWNVLYDSH